MADAEKTLYLTRTGLLEPLGQSQVLPYLRGLAGEFRITLATSEKPEDLIDSERMASAELECKRYQIDWRHRSFRSRPKVLAPVVGMLGMTWQAWMLVRRDGVRLIHARSYLPAGVAWVVWRLTGTPFIFDMRALWPEEMITAGRLRRGSLVHRALTWLERTCLRDAAAVVSLTETAVELLRERYPEELAIQRISVIPTCADLERFFPADKRPLGPQVHGCIGTVLSGWFRLDWLTAWIETASRRDPEAEFEIITRDNPARVREALDSADHLGNRLRIAAKHPDQMPETLHGHDFSVMFYAGGEVSELGRSPTRMAEVLGCGLPVVANAGVGDVGRIITDHNVGILLESPDPEHLRKAMDELDELLADPELSARCRRAAEEVFSLEEGVMRYAEIYASIISPDRP